MREQSLQTFIRAISWLLWLLAWAFAVNLGARGMELPPASIPGRLILAVSALVCLRLSRRSVPALAPASLLAMLAIWPDIWSLTLGLAVLLVLAVGPRRRVHAVSSASIALCLTYVFLASGWPRAPGPVELGLALRVVPAWAILEGARWALAQPLESFGRRSTRPPGAIELLNPVLAWVLAVVATSGWIALLVALLAIPGQALLVRLHSARRELRRVREALDARRAELLTLHAVGRELLARADDARLGPLLDRECRKLFDPDGFALHLAGETGLRTVYRREGERIDTLPVPADPQLERKLAEDKRGLCWRRDDGPLEIDLGLRHARSAMIVPLMVEDRVAGALVVESGQEDRYDEQHLAVLTTLAQQAAAALESANQQRRATIDSLTGFYLREYFFRRLAEEQRRARRYGGQFALLMIDLDGFKTVNDRYGHLAGDRYLRSVSRTIRDQLRGADMPCRYGGDEFSVLLPETDLNGASIIGERIRKAVAGLEIEAEGVLLRGTVSIGLATFPEHARSDDEKSLMRHADEALYRAKRAGRDRVVPYAA
jgi:diguanylate cyclase (GGDEF)-like protein